MTLHRFFVDVFFKPGEDKRVNDDAFLHQLRKVLRRRPGDKIAVIGSDSKEFDAVIRNYTGDGVELALGEEIIRNTEWERDVWVYQAVPKKLDKLEEVLQHGTELGAKGFSPFFSRNVHVPFLKKRDRLEKILREAAEQSERMIVPELSTELKFEEIVENSPEGLNLLAVARDVEGHVSISDLKDRLGDITLRVNIFVGPEGGFTDEEIGLARKAGFVLINFGPRILRTETAALALLAAVQFHDLP